MHLSIGAYLCSYFVCMSKKKNRKKKINKAERAKRLQAGKRFLLFFIIGVCIFYFLFSTSFFRDYLFIPVNHAFAVLASWVLNVFGEQTTAVDLTVTSSNFSVNIAKGCDSLEAISLLSIAFAALPLISWADKLKGIVVGSLIFLTLNLLRIVTLFLIGKYVPSIFDFMHVEFWQTIFLILIVIFWIYWVIRSLYNAPQPSS